MKIGLVAAELLHAEGRADGQTDRQNEAYSRFSQILRIRITKTKIRVHLHYKHICFGIRSVDNRDVILYRSTGRRFVWSARNMNGL